MLSLIQPTVMGPIKPPRLPIEVMPAIAAAAAVPLRHVEGSGQKGPYMPYRPMVAADIPASAQ